MEMTPIEKKRRLRTLSRQLTGVEVADAIGHQNLTLVPLGGRRHGRIDYILAQEAIEDGKLVVEEVDASGSVPELLVTSTSEQMILLVDGEELVGAKQNRILNTSILLPAGAKAKIPVSCVEQGRWNHTSREFRTGSHTPSGLRARKSRDVTRNLVAAGKADSDQGAVWDCVEESVTLYQAAAPTMAMSDVVEQRRDAFDAYVKAIPYPPKARGVVVAIEGKLAAVDLFDKAQTLEKLWDRLVTGYAMDAAWRPESKSGSFSKKATQVLLEHVGETECQPCPTVGIGEDWRFEAEDVVGQALVVNRTSIHLSVFPNIGEDGPARIGRGILPPSRRRRDRGTPPGNIVY